jgi:hypothetical protein
MIPGKIYVTIFSTPSSFIILIHISYSIVHTAKIQLARRRDRLPTGAARVYHRVAVPSLKPAHPKSGHRRTKVHSYSAPHGPAFSRPRLPINNLIQAAPGRICRSSAAAGAGTAASSCRSRLLFRACPAPVSYVAGKSSSKPTCRPAQHPTWRRAAAPQQL